MLKQKWAFSLLGIFSLAFAGLFVGFHNSGEALLVTALAIVFLVPVAYFGGILTVPLLLLFFNFFFLPEFASEEHTNLFLTLVNSLVLLIVFFGERRRTLEKENHQYKQAEKETQAEMERLFHLRSKLSQAAKLISLERLSAGLAHELRNPLAIMKTALRFWKPQTSKEQEAEQIVREEIVRINDLITEFLPSQTQTLQKTAVSLQSILAQALEKAQKQSSKSIRWRPQWQDVMIWGNRPSLVRMFLNVLNNAVEAVEEDGQISITTVFPEKGWVQVDVSNDGPPIPEALLENLFDPFFTDKEDGSGLGLFIAHSAAQLHHGQLTVHQNRPVTFRFMLPIDTTSVTTSREKKSISKQEKA